MSKIVLDTVVSGFSLSKINSNFQKIEDELNNKVFYRNVPVGETNTWQNLADANGNRIINLPTPLHESEAVRLSDLVNAMAGTLPGAIVLDSALSGAFFVQNGAKVQKLTDRLFVGGAVANDGRYPNVAKDWLTTLQDAWGPFGGSIVSSQAAILNNGTTSETGAVALTLGIQTKYFGSAGSSGIAGTDIVVNNHATLSTNVWGRYIEAHKLTAASGSTYGLEIDTRTLVDSISPTPFQQGNVIGQQMGSGAELTSVGQFDASAAFQIASNPMKFKVGINFLATAITGTDGVTGTGTAIAFAKGHTLNWYNSAGNIIGSIVSSNTSGSNKTALDFGSTGLQISGSTGQALGYFFNIPSAVNYVSFSAATTTNSPSINSGGSDTNVDLGLFPQGTGLVKFGTYTAGAVTQTGYITIKTASGTTVKLLTGT